MESLRNILGYKWDYLSLKDFLSPSDLERLTTLYDVKIIIDEGFSQKWSSRYYKQGEKIGVDNIRFNLNYFPYDKVEPAPVFIAPKSGVYDFWWGKYDFQEHSTHLLIKDDRDICIVYDSYLDFAKELIDKYCNYAIVDDVFAEGKQIVWEKWDNTTAFPLMILGEKPCINLQNSKEQFVFMYPKKGFSKHRFVKGDVFHFVFENKQHLHYQLKNSASNATHIGYKQVSFSMLPQDIKMFAEETLSAIRCEFANGDASMELLPENEITFLTVKLYFQKYIQALSDCGVNLDAVKVNENADKDTDFRSASPKKDSACFVYLMKDESNGYYKIGISSKPEYRERTLQSEKPTIVLLGAKEFPIRTIAEAIESALHKAYGEKRIRGEWFALNEKDVCDILCALS